MWCPDDKGPAGRAAALMAAGLFAWAGLQGCDTADHSREPALLTVLVDSGATRYSELVVILRDGAGDDTLWRGRLPDPARLRRLPTRRYHGGAAQVIVEGFDGGRRVYAESRDFDPAKGESLRDTLQDLSAPLSRFAFDTSRLFVPYLGEADLGLAIEPRKADGGVELSISDPSAVSVDDLGRDSLGVRRLRLLGLKAGLSRIIAVSKAPGARADTVDVQVSRGSETLLPPSNRSPAWSVSPYPTWTWGRGGLAGLGLYAVSLDQDWPIPEKLIADTSFTSPARLSDGPHTLFVWEKGPNDRFSPPATLVIRVDTQAPKAPAVFNEGFEATDSPRPSWTWVPQGGGIGSYRVKIDSPILDSGAVPVDSARFASPDSLAPGFHVLRVQERDAAGNWSEAGQAAVRVGPPDLIPPEAPRSRTGLGAPVWRDALTWKSGGGGAGVYRYAIDKPDFSKAMEIRDSMLIPPASLDTSIVSHVLRVQERDSSGNWSAAYEIRFLAERFTFLRSLADSNLVLTLGPDTQRVALSRRIVYPGNDAERALQKRQLWRVTPQEGVPGGQIWSNAFFQVSLTHRGPGRDAEAEEYPFPDIDSSKVWYQVRLPFAGGAPPPWYTLEALGLNEALLAEPGPGNDAGRVRLAPITLDPEQLWLVQPWLGKWWLF